MDVVTLGHFTVGRGVFEPGWRWSEDVKPIAGTDSCQVRHTGYCLSGQMTMQWEDGTEVTVGPGDYIVELVTTPGSSATSRASCSTPAYHVGLGSTTSAVPRSSASTMGSGSEDGPSSSRSKG